MPKIRQGSLERTDSNSHAGKVFNFESFNPEEEEWEYYFQRFNIQLSLHSIDSEEVCRNLLLSKLGPKPFKLLADHFRPKQVDTQSYKEITEILSSYYNVSYSIIGERVAFGRRYRNEGESINQYLSSLRSIAGRCQFKGSLDERLRDQLVLGINNTEWQKSLLRQHTEVDCSLRDVEASALVLEGADKTQVSIRPIQSTSNENVFQLKRFNTTTKFQQNVLQLIRGKDCFRCGNRMHQRNETCPADGKKCNLCSKRNHFSKVCFRSGKVQVQKERATNNVRPSSSASSRSSSTDKSEARMSIRALQAGSKVMLDVRLNNIYVEMLYDPGAEESVISKRVWQHIGSPMLEATPNLVAYTGLPIKTLGKAMVNVEAFGRSLSLPVVVVEDKDLPLFGLSWVLSFGLKLPPGSRVCTIAKPGESKTEVLQVTQLLNKYSKIFSEKLGTFKGHKAVIKLDNKAIPKTCKPRPIPYSLRPAVEEELKRLVQEGVLEQVDPTSKNILWSSPIVVVVKPSGKIRICGDFKVTINPFITSIHHPLPRFEDILTKLQGGCEYSTLDLKDAYLQLEVDDSSKDLLIISTPFGYYRYSRMPFGIRSAPGIFQRKIEQVLEGLQGVAVYLDDCIITGRNREEHLQNLEEVLRRFLSLGINILKSKCRFLQSSVDYLGHRIDAHGIHPTDKHIAAIKQMPAPTNVRDLRAFLGVINYYQRFVPNLQCISSPLHNLLKKEVPWDWKASDDNIFKKLKGILSSSDTLVHYDSKLPIIVDSDASDKGLGAVLSHQFPDGSIRPVMFASRVLHQAEKKYSVIDKEALGIIFAVTKFYNYIYGRHFILRTDHKPLVHILGEHSDLPRITSDRLTRWAVTLGAFDYEIRYNEGRLNAPADVLSRLPYFHPENAHSIKTEFGRRVTQLRLEDIHLTKKTLKHHISTDKEIQMALNHMENAWPDKRNLVNEMRPFYEKREELSFEDGVLLWKGRLVIPKMLRQTVLKILHEGHPGIVSMRSYARFHVWWPRMDSNIEDFVRSCKNCQTIRNQEPELPLFSWTVPQEPWSRIHVDYAGPFEGQYWFVVVDSTSKWLEVFPTKSITSEKTISFLEELFARLGLPKMIVSDNGPQFTSFTFKQFCGLNNIRHVTVAPYHPRSNGLAERYVQTFKRRFRASNTDGTTFKERLLTFLFKYRTTPHQTTGRTPADVLYGRQLRSKLSLLKPDMMAHVDEALVKQKKHHDKHSRWREFKQGDAVWVKQQGEDYREGVILKKTGPVSYLVEEDGRAHRRHGDQLRQRRPMSRRRFKGGEM